MIIYHLFEHTPPFAGVDPVEAAKMAALDNKRPKLVRLAEQKSPMPVRDSFLQYPKPNRKTMQPRANFSGRVELFDDSSC